MEKNIIKYFRRKSSVAQGRVISVGGGGGGGGGVGGGGGGGGGGVDAALWDFEILLVFLYFIKS